MSLDELLGLLEKATKADRLLDIAIAEFVGHSHGRADVWEDDGKVLISLDECALHYTESVDAAMMLIPDGWNWIFHGEWFGSKTPNPCQFITATIRSPDARYEGDYDRTLVAGRHASGIQRPSLALALCVAGMRAKRLLLQDMPVTENK